MSHRVWHNFIQFTKGCCINISQKIGSFNQSIIILVHIIHNIFVMLPIRLKESQFYLKIHNVCDMTLNKG